MRFRAEQHLRRQRDIQAVREQGRRFDCGAFTLWYLRRPSELPVSAPGSALSSPVDPAPDRPSPAARTSPRPSSRSAVPATLKRVCVVASTAAVGDAIARARAKRRLREIFRHHQDAVPAGYDLMLVARKSINGLEYREIERKFIEACPRIAPRSA